MKRSAEKMYEKTTADVNTRIRVGVGVIIRDHRGWILLEKRSDCGLWGLPGGRIEPGESVIDAAARETKEETGLSVKFTRLIGVYSSTAAHRIVTYPDNGDVVHLVDIVIGAIVNSGELSCSEESEELKFFDPEELPSDMVPPARQPLMDDLRGLSGQIA